MALVGPNTSCMKRPCSSSTDATVSGSACAYSSVAASCSISPMWRSVKRASLMGARYSDMSVGYPRVTCGPPARRAAVNPAQTCGLITAIGSEMPDLVHRAARRSADPAAPRPSGVLSSSPRCAAVRVQVLRRPAPGRRSRSARRWSARPASGPTSSTITSPAHRNTCRIGRAVAGGAAPAAHLETRRLERRHRALDVTGAHHDVVDARRSRSDAAGGVVVDARRSARRSSGQTVDRRGDAVEGPPLEPITGSRSGAARSTQPHGAVGDHEAGSGPGLGRVAQVDGGQLSVRGVHGRTVP